MSVLTSRFGPKLNKYENFQPLEVVGCVSETQQLQPVRNG